MSEGTHNTSGKKYNQMVLSTRNSGETLTAEITNESLFLSHEQFEELDEFAEEFLDEIDIER